MYTSFFLAFILLLQSFSHGLADDQSIADVCAKTTIPDDCKSVLMSDSRSKEATTISEFAAIAFDIAINSAIAAHTAAVDLLKQFIDNDRQQALSRCLQIYSNIVAELNEAKELVQSSKFEDANKLAFNAEMEPDTCDTQFVSRNMTDLLLQSNHDLTRTSAVCAALTYLLKS